MLQFGASLRSVNYDHNMFIIQATGTEKNCKRWNFIPVAYTMNIITIKIGDTITINYDCLGANKYHKNITIIS